MIHQSCGLGRTQITAMSVMKDTERLEILKEVGGTSVYETRRTESLKILHDADGKRQRINELASALFDILFWILLANMGTTFQCATILWVLWLSCLLQFRTQHAHPNLQCHLELYISVILLKSDLFACLLGIYLTGPGCCIAKASDISICSQEHNGCRAQPASKSCSEQF